MERAGVPSLAVEVEGGGVSWVAFAAFTLCPAFVATVSLGFPLPFCIASLVWVSGACGAGMSLMGEGIGSLPVGIGWDVNGVATSWVEDLAPRVTLEDPEFEIEDLSFLVLATREG